MTVALAPYERVTVIRPNGIHWTFVTHSHLRRDGTGQIPHYLRDLVAARGQLVPGYFTVHNGRGYDDYALAYAEEGVTWVRGNHAENSDVVRALQVACMLVAA